MADQMIYNKTIIEEGNQLRLIADQAMLYMHFNGNLLFSATYQPYTPFRQQFSIETNGKLSTYDITFLLNAYAKCLISKNGWIIYSDDPGISVFE